MENSKYFYIWIGLSALLIAGSAAAFSVYGLAKLFSGAFISVVIMASSLELGKLVTASFLYRYWNMITWFQKVYMTFATLELEKQSTELIAVEERIEQLEEDKVFLKGELEEQVNSLPENFITAKRKVREEYNPRILAVNDEILEYKKTRADLEIQLVSTGVDVGPAIYLARTFGTDIDTVVKFFIFILIFVFDPLAVMLVVAYNQALILREKELPQEKKSWWSRIWEMYDDKYEVDLSQGSHQSRGFAALQELDELDEIAEQEKKFVEDNERMDIIGQNGNDGLHYDIEPEVEPREENDPRPKKLKPPSSRSGVRIG